MSVSRKIGKIMKRSFMHPEKLSFKGRIPARAIRNFDFCNEFPILEGKKKALPMSDYFVI